MIIRAIEAYIVLDVVLLLRNKSMLNLTKLFMKCHFTTCCTSLSAIFLYSCEIQNKLPNLKINNSKIAKFKKKLAIRPICFEVMATPADTIL